MKVFSTTPEQELLIAKQTYNKLENLSMTTTIV